MQSINDNCGVGLLNELVLCLGEQPNGRIEQLASGIRHDPPLDAADNEEGTLIG